MSICDIYDDLLCNKINRFPLHTWNQTNSKNLLIELLRYQVLEKLEWNREIFCENFSYTFIAKSKLRTGFKKVYKNNVYSIAKESFPEWNINAWELKRSSVPEDFWNIETAIKATKWLIEQQLNWDLNKVNREISRIAFQRNHLGGMLALIDLSLPELIEKTYPDYDWCYLKERSGYKITATHAMEIREMYRSGFYSQSEIAKIYQITPSNVCLIINNRYFPEVTH